MSLKNRLLTFTLSALAIAGTFGSRELLSAGHAQDKSFKTDYEKPENQTPGMSTILNMLDAANLVTLDKRDMTDKTAISADMPEGIVSEWKAVINSDLQEHGSDRTFDDFAHIQQSRVNGNQRVKFNVAQMQETITSLGGSLDLAAHISEHTEVSKRVAAHTLPSYP